MRFATINYGDSSTAIAIFADDSYGIVRDLPGRQDNYDVLSLIESPLLEEEVGLLQKNSLHIDPDQDFLPPLVPPKNVLCVGKNYIAHAIEGALAEGRATADVPTAPIWFTKAHTSLVGKGGLIKASEAYSDSLDYEGELAVVIGSKSFGLTRENALDAVYGYAIFNDITSRDLQQERKQWFKGKSADTFGPFGPWIVTANEIEDPQDLMITTRVNGEIRQNDSTKNMIFNVIDLLVDISSGVTLEPGDVIATGTPEGVAWGKVGKYLRPGDLVSVEIEKIGRLDNTVAG